MKKKLIIGIVLGAVAVLAWWLWKRGALQRTQVTPPSVGVRSAIGSNFFSVFDRTGGNIMSNLNAPENSPVSAGPVNVGSPRVGRGILGRLRLVA